MNLLPQSKELAFEVSSLILNYLYVFIYYEIFDNSASSTDNIFIWILDLGKAIAIKI